MITAEFFVDHNNLIFGFNLKGHSGYAPSGEDIVCAAVSSAAFMTVNTLTEILKLSPKIEVSDDGHMSVLFSQVTANDAQTLLQGFNLHMNALAEQFNDNIHIIYSEVL